MQSSLVHPRRIILYKNLSPFTLSLEKGTKEEKSRDFLKNDGVF